MEKTLKNQLQVVYPFHSKFQKNITSPNGARCIKEQKLFYKNKT